MIFNRLFGFGTFAVVIIGLGLAFVFLGTPSHQRLVSLDERRVGDLEKVASSLHNGYQTGSLPERLPEYLATVDPVTKRTYEFRRLDPTHYLLCAVFSTNEPAADGAEYSDVVQAFPHAAWRHGAGRACFKFDVTQTPPVPSL